MATVYFVDSENVGDSWIEAGTKTEDRVVVFYTKNSPRIAYSHVIRLMDAANKVEFVECYEGHNALDFQLVSVLGYEINKESSDEMIIVSNDTGFDVVVKFWTDRGRNVRRVSCIPLCAQPSEEESGEEFHFDFPSEEKSDVELRFTIQSEPEKPTRNGIDVEEIYTIINCIGADDPSNIHNVFRQFYGEDGIVLYRKMRNEEFAVPIQNWSKDIRLKKMVQLIVQHKIMGRIPVPDSLVGFISQNIVDNKKLMRDMLNEEYEKEGEIFHILISSFYGVLDKIKKY